MAKENKDGKPRATPGKMTTWLGRWLPPGSVTLPGEHGQTDKAVFVVEDSDVAMTGAGLKNSLRRLGFGDYASITGRTTEHKYGKIEKEVFA